MFEKPFTLGIVGTGMIGCSIAAYIKKHNPFTYSPKILGYSKGQSAQRAKELQLIDEVCSIDQLHRQSDMIIYSAPVLAIIKLFAEAPAPTEQQLVIDCGSVKQAIIQAAKKHWQQQSKHFIPCHPLCGLEKTGPEAADDKLYQGAKIIISPTPENPPEKVEQVVDFWQRLGGKIHQIDPFAHDQVLAQVSHLPHLLAFSLVTNMLNHHGEQCFEWSAGGFRDFTRIASSSPKMWCDIALSNQQPILTSLRQYIEELQQLEQAIANADNEYIEKQFTLAKQARDAYYTPQV